MADPAKMRREADRLESESKSSEAEQKRKAADKIESDIRSADSQAQKEGALKRIDPTNPLAPPSNDYK